MYPQRDMRMEVALVYISGGLDWRVRWCGLEHWVAWLDSLLGITERV